VCWFAVYSCTAFQYAWDAIKIVILPMLLSVGLYCSYILQQTFFPVCISEIPSVTLQNHVFIAISLSHLGI
jgi:hypothetical protein